MAHLRTDPTLLAVAVMSERCGWSRVSVFKMSLLFERPFPPRGYRKMRNAYGYVDPLLMEDPRRPRSSHQPIAMLSLGKVHLARKAINVCKAT